MKLKLPLHQFVIQNSSVVVVVAADLCLNSLNQLSSLQLIHMDEENMDVKPTSR